MSRGITTLQIADTSWEQVFGGADGTCSRFGIEAPSGNSGRVQVRYSTAKGINYASVGPGGYKLLGGGKNQVTKIEIQGDGAGQQFYFDLVLSED